MTLGRRFIALAAAAACIGMAPAHAETGNALAPYQMVRSLQLVQDRIAAGDHAAIPMQRKLLQMIDQRFQDTESEDYNDLRNFRAMLVYAMSGGNPRTIEVALARIHLDETNRALGIGILNYLRGNHKSAKAVLDDVDPMAIAPELGAFFALVKGSVNAIDDAETAFVLFDEARLLAPGTLVEEAALRRSISLAASSADAKRFIRASEAYVRRFLASPYASQFADAFVAGVIQLGADMDRVELADVVSKMEPAQQKTIYLRLARRGAIDGNAELAAFASKAAEEIKVAGFGPDGDPRAELYASLAAVTSETVAETAQRLAKIDRKLLSANDRLLLEAAEAMATEVTSTPASAAASAVTPPAVAGAPSEAEIDEAGLVPEGEPLPATDAHAADAAVAEPAAAEAPADPDAVALVGDARKKLEEIDKLLGETK